MAKRMLSRRDVLGSLAALPLGTSLPALLSASAHLPLDQQVHMQAAKDSLQQALGHLRQATSDKGGHRAAAIKATEDAIKHVEQGIRFDRRN